MGFFNVHLFYVPSSNNAVFNFIKITLQYLLHLRSKKFGLKLLQRNVRGQRSLQKQKIDYFICLFEKYAMFKHLLPNVSSSKLAGFSFIYLFT